MKIYENILKGRVKYPPYVHPDAQDLLQKLITPDLTKRLGNLHGGSKDVMNHPWFAEVTWERLAKKDIDAPYVPPVRAGAGDASQFDKYPEETEAYGASGDDTYERFLTPMLCRTTRLTRNAGMDLCFRSFSCITGSGPSLAVHRTEGTGALHYCFAGRGGKGQRKKRRQQRRRAILRPARRKIMARVC